ncbi:MAG TPA: TFIIB-type zinc ribbon-containing protein [Nitrososphaeraceae archaeon]|nr:TFIIB-type zinc ribbon-containing protein [Nitrososphaeraceae archaeon]
MVTKLREIIFLTSNSNLRYPVLLLLLYVPFCGNDQIINDSESGEMLCRRCGQVISDRIQETLPEWRNFPDIDESKNRNRTGMSASLARHDMGLSTIIGRSDKDASGHPLDAVMRTTMARLRTWDSRSRSHTSTARNLPHAFDQLYALKDKLGLSDAVLEKTAHIYRKAQDKRLVRGSTISAILIAAVYAAYRETGIARTLKDLSTTSNIKRKDIARSYMLIATELDLKVQ